MLATLTKTWWGFRSEKVVSVWFRVISCDFVWFRFVLVYGPFSYWFLWVFNWCLACWKEILRLRKGSAGFIKIRERRLKFVKIRILFHSSFLWWRGAFLFFWGRGELRGEFRFLYIQIYRRGDLRMKCSDRRKKGRVRGKSEKRNEEWWNKRSKGKMGWLNPNKNSLKCQVSGLHMIWTLMINPLAAYPNTESFIFLQRPFFPTCLYSFSISRLFGLLPKAGCKREFISHEKESCIYYIWHLQQDSEPKKTTSNKRDLHTGAKPVGAENKARGSFN